MRSWFKGYSNQTQNFRTTEVQPFFFFSNVTRPLPLTCTMLLKHRHKSLLGFKISTDWGRRESKQLRGLLVDQTEFRSSFYQEYTKNNSSQESLGAISYVIVALMVQRLFEPNPKRQSEPLKCNLFFFSIVTRPLPLTCTMLLNHRPKSLLGFKISTDWGKKESEQLQLSYVIVALMVQRLFEPNPKRQSEALKCILF